MMEFGSMWNRILLLVCIGLCACSVMDPEIPDYESSEKDPLPLVTIQSADRIFLREATLSIVLSPMSSRKPRSLYLCYGKDSDQPDIMQQKIDLLPLYKEGTIEVNVTNLLPSTLYYCRVYAETRNEKGYSDVFKFRTSTSDTDIAWKKVADFPNRKAFYNRVFTIGGHLFFLECEMEEGENAGGTAIWKFVPDACTWEKVTDFPGGKRCSPVIYAMNDKIYMGFGYVPDRDDRMDFKDDLWEYDFSDCAWKRLPDLPVCYTHLMASFVHKGKGYLVSTGAMWTEYPMKVEMFDPVSGKWTKKADFPGEKVDRALALVVDDRIFVVGGSYAYGCEPQHSNCLWEYAPDTDTWFRRADFPGTGRSEMQGFVVGGRLYAGFGYENTHGDWLDYTRDLWEYFPDRDVWEPRAGITMWSPNCFTFSTGTDRGGYIGSVEYGLWMYSPDKDK